MKWTGFALVAISIAAGALALSGHKSVVQPAPASTPAIYPCSTSQLAWEPGQEGGAAGHIGITGASFVNTSATPCSLIGHPKLQMLDSDGTAIPTFTLDGPSVTVPDIESATVVIAPQERAYVDLGFSNGTGYGFMQCPTSAEVQITPPENTDALTVSWQIQPFGGVSIQQLHCGEIYVSPVYKTLRN